ncbi:MAG TPA: AsmA-like C-terminal region-containing protein [Cytophagaceae bacterium]|nr:AsmA-like C-terminal region-containing protein [Cytophagaceae bacterium]
MNNLRQWFKKNPGKIFGLVILFALAIVLVNLPAFFKKEVKAKLLEAIDQKVNAQVLYSDLSFSSLKNFPNTTLTFHNLLVIGNVPFEKDTFLIAPKLSVSFDLISILKGEKIELNSIALEQPIIQVLINEEGKANYDLMKSGDSSDSTEVEVKLDLWTIEDGTIRYTDLAQKQYIVMQGVQHKGKGDFKSERSDLYLFLDIKNLSYKAGKIRWFTDKSFLGEMVIDMDLKNNIFTFKDHDLKLNHLDFGINGNIGMPDSGFVFDLTWNLKKSSFSDLLSVLPGFYKEEMKKLKAKGNLTCSGYVKGMYSDHQLPGYGLKLAIDKASLAYPGLSQSFDHIFLDLSLDNPYGIEDSLEVDIKKLTMKMGDHPLSGRMKMKGIKRKYFDAELEGRLKLEELSAFYPVKGLVLKGDLYSDITVKGFYDKERNEMPIIDASLSFEKGYIRDSLYPSPVENIEFWATVENKGGSLKDTKIDLGKLSFNLETDTIEIAGTIEDLTDPLFNVRVNGEVDLEKTLAHFNLQDIKMKGKIFTTFESAGRWSSIEKKNWRKLKTEGILVAKNVVIKTPSLPRRIHIYDAQLGFFPDRIQLDTLHGRYGTSRMLLSGHLLDPYSLLLDDKNRQLVGDLNMVCDTLNLNEFTVENSSELAVDTNISAVVIPEGIHFTIDSKISKVIMEDLTIQQLEGEIQLVDQTIVLTKSSFQLAGSDIECFGVYDSHDPMKPTFDFNFVINNLDINRTYQEVPLVRKLAPAMADAHGKLSVTYWLKGELDKNMDIQFHTLVGKGSMDIEEANIKGIKMMEAVSKATGRNDLHHEPLKGVFIRSEISNGKMFLLPFTFTTGKYVLDIEGNHSFENEMNYLLKVSMLPLAKIKVPVHITGTTDDYKVHLGKGFDHKSLEE